jgi:hypothetical protein
MRRWVRIASAAAGGLAAAAAAAVAAGGLVWRRATEQSVSGLMRRVMTEEDAAVAPSAGRPPAVGTFSQARLDELPPPVARYFAFALPTGQRRIRAARIRWAGEFQLRPGGGWRPFTAEQHYTAEPPGFVWDAAIRMMPLVPMRVRDAYVSGDASMLGRMGGVVPIVDVGGTPEIASSALARWLGEAAWFPTALLPPDGPGDGVRWEPVDDSTARATVTDGATRVQAEFHFAHTGALTTMTAMRYRDVGGTAVLTPFEGSYGDYRRRDGLMIPMSAEVAWLLPEGRFPYWRGHPVEVHYELTPPAPSVPAESESRATAGSTPGGAG